MPPSLRTQPILYFSLILLFILTGTRTISAQTSIFADGFESGDTSAWSSTIPGAAFKASLDVNASAATVGSFGLEVSIDNVNVAYVQDDSPAGETTYAALFRLHPNAVTLPPGDQLTLFTTRDLANSVNPFLIRLRFDSGNYQIQVEYVDDAGTPFTNILDAPNMIQVEWQAASTPGANDGVILLLINNVSSGSSSTIDNDMLVIDFARWGLSTQFSLVVAHEQHVSLDVYDVTGHHITTLYEGLIAENRPHLFRFEAADLPGGLYMIRATGENFVETQQVTLVK
jgi:hypothetical protein